VQAVSAAEQPHNPNDPKGVVGGYLLLGPKTGMAELKALANNAKNLPVNRIWVSFFSPNMVYKKNSRDLSKSGLAGSGKFNFLTIKTCIAKLQKGGVEVFLSMGGWDYNCFPYLYMRYSVGGYGTHTPNFWSIEKYGGGTVDGCTAENEYCYVCEPESAGETLSNFQLFPEPDWSASYQEAQRFVEQLIQRNSSSPPAEWHGKASGLYAGNMWTDNNASRTLLVPGDSTFVEEGRDPYQDFVQLATELGAAGIDLDYEEFWHADYFKACETVDGKCDMTNGPWLMWQTVYKYAAIAKDLMINIQRINPDLMLSCPVGAASAWQGKWWGGNLKGLVYKTKQIFPEVIDFMTKGANAGGVNVMSYDLSDDPTYHECPPTGGCSLSDQVEFYLKTYTAADIPAGVGYEVGQPAYPSPEVNKEHQLPLTEAELQKIITTTQPKHKAAFFWELYKKTNSALHEATVTETAQKICKAVLGSDTDRCSGSIPPIGPTPAPVPTHPTPPAPKPTPVPGPGPPGNCHSISRQVTDKWCNENCHNAIPYCPAAFCKCDP
jgi:hypothetical protein